MSLWYYYDMSGNRKGPIDSRKIRELAAQGVIVPETQLETDTGKKGLAKQIKGLFSNSSTHDIYQIRENTGKERHFFGMFPLQISPKQAKHV